MTTMRLFEAILDANHRAVAGGQSAGFMRWQGVFLAGL